MDDAVGAKLRELLTPSVRDELLDDPRRLAELVRERLGIDRRREASFLNTVMQEGVPKRLLAMPAGSLTSAMIANYARKVSEDTGLKEDVARSAIEAWSVGLGLRVSVDKPRPDSGTKPELDQRAGLPEGGKHRESVSEGAGPGIREIRGIGIAMALSGAAAIFISSRFLAWSVFSSEGGLLVFSSKGGLLRVGLPTFALAAATIYAGLALVLIYNSSSMVHDTELPAIGQDVNTPFQEMRKVAIAACAVDAIILCLLSTGIFVSGSARGASLHSDGAFFLIMMFAGALLFLVMTFRLYRWRATPVSSVRNLLDPTAVLLLVGGLFGLWAFGININFRIDLLPYQLPFDLAMIFMGVAILAGSPRLAHRASIAAVCFISAILGACDLWSIQAASFEWKTINEIGMLTDVLVLGILIFGYMRRRNDVASAG